MKTSMLVSRNKADVLYITESCYICKRNFSTKQNQTTMKKKITALLAGIFALIVTVHAQQPTVTFTATPAVVCAGGSVTFTNTTVNFPTSWHWYFPGGSPSYTTGVGAAGNPATPIKYNFPGTYSVTCVVKNNNPPPNTDSVTMPMFVTVLPLPKATIIPPYGGICDNTPPNLDTIYFHMIDTSAGNTYVWSPSNTNTPDLSCTNCEKPYAYPTNYTVFTVTVTGADGCSITLHDTVTAGSITAHITGRDTLCAGMVDTLYASGGSSNPPGTIYSWSNGKTTSSIIVTPPIGLTTYSVNINSGIGGCNASTTYPVYVYPVPSFTLGFSPADSICAPGFVNISVGGAGSNTFSWFGPPYGDTVTTDFIAAPPVTTIYTLVVHEPLGCTFDSLVKVKVNYPPHVSFTGATDLCDGSFATICASGGEQYAWSTGASTSCINIEAISGIAGLTYTVQVSSGECYKDTSFSVAFDSMPHNTFFVFPDTSICVGDSVSIYASSNNRFNTPGYQYTYLWNTGSTLDSINVGKRNVFLTPGVYTSYLTVTHGACSLDSAQINIKVYLPPNPRVFPADTTICQWDSVKLTAEGGQYYAWSSTPGPKWTPAPEGLGHYFYIGDTDRVKASPNGLPPLDVAPAVTIYTVYVCSWGCCKRDTAIVNVTAGVTGFNVCCNETVPAGTPVNLSATFNPEPSYEVQAWTPATGLSCDNCPNPTATVDTTTKYVVTFLDLGTGCFVNDSVTITIFNCNVFVPNAFSPNGDGVNDFLYVRSLCMKSMDFIVFDRFGNKVFETTVQDKGWDGTFKGKPMEVGTYMWELSALLSDGTHIAKSGNVTLVR